MATAATQGGIVTHREDLKRRKLSEVRARLRMVWRELQRMLKIVARGGSLPGTRFEHTQIVPVVGIFWLQAQRLILFFDGLLQLAGLSQNLRQERVETGIAGRERNRIAQLNQCIVRTAGLREGHGQMFARIEIVRPLLCRGLQQIDGSAGLAGLDCNLAQLIEGREVLRIEFEGVLELSLSRGRITFACKGCSESAVGCGIVGAAMEHRAKLICRIPKSTLSQFKRRKIEAWIAGVRLGLDGVREGLFGCRQVS